MKTQRYTLKRTWPIPGDMDLDEAVDEARSALHAEIMEHVAHGFTHVDGPITEIRGHTIICTARLDGPDGQAWSDTDMARRGDPSLWHQHAACLGLDQDIFFEPQHRDYALRLCSLCPVVAACRAAADVEEGRADHVYGVRGNEVPTRRVMRRRWARQQWLAGKRDCMKCRRPSTARHQTPNTRKTA